MPLGPDRLYTETSSSMAERPIFDAKSPHITEFLFQKTKLPIKTVEYKDDVKLNYMLKWESNANLINKKMKRCVASICH